MNTPNENQLHDKTIICCDCQEPFLFNTGEQAYYIKNGLHIPKRCPKCRVIRKLGYSPGVHPSEGGEH